MSTARLSSTCATLAAPVAIRPKGEGAGLRWRDIVAQFVELTLAWLERARQRRQLQSPERPHAEGPGAQPRRRRRRSLEAVLAPLIARRHQPPMARINLAGHRLHVCRRPAPDDRPTRQVQAMMTASAGIRRPSDVAQSSPARGPIPKSKYAERSIEPQVTPQFEWAPCARSDASSSATCRMPVA